MYSVTIHLSRRLLPPQVAQSRLRQMSNRLQRRHPFKLPRLLLNYRLHQRRLVRSPIHLSLPRLIHQHRSVSLQIRPIHLRLQHRRPLANLRIHLIRLRVPRQLRLEARLFRQQSTRQASLWVRQHWPRSLCTMFPLLVIPVLNSPVLSIPRGWRRVTSR